MKAEQSFAKAAASPWRNLKCASRFMKMLHIIVAGVCFGFVIPCQAAPMIVGAQGLKFIGNGAGTPSLSLSSGGQLYIYGMATGGAAPSSTFANGQTIQITNASGNVSAELAVTTESTNSYATGTANDAFGGFGVSGFNFVQGFLGANPGPGPNLQASVSFTLYAPALVVVMGMGSSQATLAFSGLDNPTLDVSDQTIDGVHEPVLGIEHEYLKAGTYTIQETAGDGTAFYQTPANEVDLIGVLIFSDRPNAATSSNSQITIPLAPNSQATSNNPISISRYLGWGIVSLAIIGMAIAIFRLTMPRRGGQNQ